MVKNNNFFAFILFLLLLLKTKKKKKKKFENAELIENIENLKNRVGKSRQVLTAEIFTKFQNRQTLTAS